MRMITKEQLKDRLRAFAVFTGIAIGAVSGFELIITGGFDPLTPRAMSSAYAEPAERSTPYTQESFAYDAAHRGYTPTSYAANAMYDVTPASMALAAEDLAGAPGEEPASFWEARVPTPSSAELYAEIDRLYREEAPAPSRFASEDTDEPAGWQEAEDAYAYAYAEATPDEAYPEDIWSEDLH